MRQVYTGNLCKTKVQQTSLFSGLRITIKIQMKITLVGAAGGEVTGSCYVVETQQGRILVDCGLFQGGKSYVCAEDLALARIPDSQGLGAAPARHNSFTASQNS